jgi:hypothetical protein
VAAGSGSMMRSGRLLVACLAIVCAVSPAFAPAALADGLSPDPDPNASQIQPQPDPYQGASAGAQSTPTRPETHPVIPKVVDAPPAPTESPPASSRPETHVALATAVPAPQTTTVQVSRPAPSQARKHRQIHHSSVASRPKTPYSFAESALRVRWPAALATSVAAARPHDVPAGVALAVAAVVLLSAAFLAMAARQAVRQAAR